MNCVAKFSILKWTCRAFKQRPLRTTYPVLLHSFVFSSGGCWMSFNFIYPQCTVQCTNCIQHLLCPTINIRCCIKWLRQSTTAFRFLCAFRCVTQDEIDRLQISLNVFQRPHTHTHIQHSTAHNSFRMRLLILCSTNTHTLTYASNFRSEISNSFEWVREREKSLQTKSFYCIHLWMFGHVNVDGHHHHHHHRWCSLLRRHHHRSPYRRFTFSFCFNQPHILCRSPFNVHRNVSYTIRCGQLHNGEPQRLRILLFDARKRARNTTAYDDDDEEGGSERVQ